MGNKDLKSHLGSFCTQAFNDFGDMRLARADSWTHSRSNIEIENKACRVETE